MQFKQPLYTCVAGALGLAVSAGAMAQDNVPQDKRFYVAPMVSYGFFDSDTIGGGNDSIGSVNVDNDDSVGASLAIGKPITSWLNLELFGFYFNPDQDLNGNGAGDADLYGFGLDALFFPARDTFPVYGILGASWGKKDVGFSSVNGANVGDDADADFLDAVRASHLQDEQSSQPAEIISATRMMSASERREADKNEKEKEVAKLL